MISTVTTKGRIIIPMPIRKRYGIQPNDKIDFIVDGDRIILTPIKSLRDLRGAVTTKSGDFETERQAAKKSAGTRNSEEVS